MFIFFVRELFNIAVDDFDSKNSTHFSWVLVASGTQCSFLVNRSIGSHCKMIQTFPTVLEFVECALLVATVRSYPFFTCCRCHCKVLHQRVLNKRLFKKTLQTRVVSSFVFSMQS